MDGSTSRRTYTQARPKVKGVQANMPGGQARPGSDAREVGWRETEWLGQ